MIAGEPRLIERDGSIKPQCEHVTGYDDKWVFRRHTAIEQTWEGCQYAGCYGDTEATTTGDTGPQLAATLAEMSATEFETTVAAHRTALSEDGEQA